MPGDVSAAARAHPGCRSKDDMFRCRIHSRAEETREASPLHRDDVPHREAEEVVGGKTHLIRFRNLHCSAQVSGFPPMQ